MNLFYSACWALFSGVLLYVVLHGVLHFARPGNRRRPVRTEEALVLVVVGSSAAQVFATQPVGRSLLLLGLLSALAYLGLRLSPRFTRHSVAADTPPILLLYRGCLLPDALADVAWSEAELRQHLYAQGVTALGQLHAIVLESNGRLGIIKQPTAEPLYPVHLN